MPYLSTLLAYFLFPFALALPATNLAHSATPQAYLSLITFRHATSNRPCSGISSTVAWPLDFVSWNSTGKCFDDDTHHFTCLRRMFTQIEEFNIDTAPRRCSVAGYQKRYCDGPRLPASYNGAAEWTWDGSDMGIDIRSFALYCAETGAPSIGVDGN